MSYSLVRLSDVSKVKEILPYLKEILPRDGVDITAHKISRNRERAIAVLPRDARTARETAIGGLENRSFEVGRITLLLRWGRDGCAAEAKAAEIYAALAERDEDFGFIRAVNAAPVWLGMDEHGIFEHVIDFDVYVKKEEKHGISCK